MNSKIILTTSTLLGALALCAVTPASAADGMMKPAMEKCYGVSASGKNDCAAGAHSCAGQSTKNFDKTSFVELPKGACGKLAGGSLMAGK